MLILALLAAACEPVPEIAVDADAVEISVMSYNLAAATGARAQTLATHVDSIAPDFLSAQECADCDAFVELLAAGYAATTDARSGVALIYDDTSWRLEDRRAIVLGDNDDGWGERIAEWGRFQHRETLEQVDVYATHWCVTVRTLDDDCDQARQLDYVDAIIRDAMSRIGSTSLILAGDLNVFDGFETGVVINELLASGLRDVFRGLHPTVDATTFGGNSFAPAGRIDYIFASEPVSSLAATVERDAVPDGEGSDHFAVTATLRFDGL